MKQKKHIGGQPFSLRERSIIEVRWGRDAKSISEIARELGRNKGSVSREVAGSPRHGIGKYHADSAHRKALERISRRGNVAKITVNKKLRAYIEERMAIGWSPEQVSIRLPIDFPGDRSMRISPEAVYQEVYRRVRREGNGRVKDGVRDLRPYLARRHTRRAKKGFRKTQREERVHSLPSIEQRPMVAERRSRIGDWEDDTLVSRASLARVKSVVERRSGVAFFGRTRDGTAIACDRVLWERMRTLPASLRRTLTRDRGSENMGWESVRDALHITVFFAHAYASYERGTNENTNGLLRRYFPKKTNWALVSDDDIARVEYLINTRPRKRLGGLTPVEVFYRETGVAIYS